MGLITGMDYRNGHLYVSLSAFILFLKTDWPKVYTESDKFENHVV